MGLRPHARGLARHLNDHMKAKAWSYTPTGNPGTSNNPLQLANYTGRRNLDNLFSGYERNWRGKWATGAVGVGITGYMAVTAPQRAVEQRTQNYVEQQRQEGGVESLMTTRGDEIGYAVNMQRLSDLQSQGDLVFALNRLRN